jgi:hypothetical protein
MSETPEKIPEEEFMPPEEAEADDTVDDAEDPVANLPDHEEDGE